jgi:tRNA-Thr(GGU) m(6)t(6)A37 methyltransferase TsaA
MEYRPIGIIHTPFKDVEGMPIQPSAAKGIPGRVEVYPEFLAGLKDLDGFSHITLLYHVHRSTEYALTVIPFMDTRPRGVFATRAPRRPNPIGLSTVRLIKIEGNILHVENVDMLEGTPLLDIKPYVPEFDDREGRRVGWLEKATGRVKDKKSDGRFK